MLPMARGFAGMAILLCGIAGVAMTAQAAQNYPIRPIRLIIPQSPGGPSDIIGRLVAAKLGEFLGQTVVADNRGGAGGNVGCEMAAKAVPDGYTMLLGAGGCLVNNLALYDKLAYDPLRDFQPVTQLTSGPQVLVLHPSVAATSVKDFVALVRSRPGQLNYSSGGAGTINHLAVELFKSAADLQIVHVPFKGTGPAITALLGGQTQLMMASMPPALPHVKAGRLRALGVTSAQRSRVAPELPTIAESGYPGFETVSLHSILVPFKTPKPIVARLHADLMKVLADPDTRDRLLGQGLDVVGNTPEAFAAFIKAEQQKWVKIIRALGIKAD